MIYMQRYIVALTDFLRQTTSFKGGEDVNFLLRRF
jgi:hypothetical protein